MSQELEEIKGEMAAIIDMIASEILRSRQKYPGNSGRWSAIVYEFCECGIEVQGIKKGIHQHSDVCARLRDESIQLAGTCFRMLLEGDPDLHLPPAKFLK